MTNLLIEIAAYLQAELIVSGYGIDTFVDYEPDDPSSIVVINEYAGLPSQTGIESARRSIQILTRDASSEIARAKAWQIYNFLDTPDDRIHHLNAERVCILAARQAPFKMRVDKTNRPVWGFNMGVTTINDK